MEVPKNATSSDTKEELSEVHLGDMEEASSSKGNSVTATGSEEDACVTEAANPDNAATSRISKRKKLISAFLASILILIVILIPTVFVKKDKSSDANDGPFYGLVSTAGISSGEAKMSDDGTRLFVIQPTDSENVLHILDLVDDEWVVRAELFPNNEGSNTRIDALDISGMGDRFVVKVRRSPDEFMLGTHSVEVYEDLSGTGTEWQLTAAFDPDTWMELDAVTPYSCREGGPQEANISVTDYQWVEAIAMSNDGNIIALGDESTSFSAFYCSGGGIDEYDSTGAVQAFQHVNSIVDESDERLALYPNSTWIPIGQMLLGRFSDEKMGSRVVLSGNGRRMVVTEGLFRSDNSGGRVSVFDLDVESKQWEESKRNLAYASFAREKTSVIDISNDGKVIAVAQADFTPSAYSPSPYQGSIELLRDTGKVNEFGGIEFDEYILYGGTGFRHFGYSMDVVDHVGDDDDVSYSIVVGSKNTRSQNFPQGDMLEVYTLSNHTSFRWTLRGPAVGHPLVKKGWDSVALSADASRLAAVGTNLGECQVYIYDYTA